MGQNDDDANVAHKGKPLAARDKVKVDHDTGMIHVPGVGDLPLVGPTSGRQYKDLQEAEAQHNADMSRLKADMAALWQCIQCKRVWPGTKVRFSKDADPATGERFYVCPDLKCDAPVVRVDPSPGGPGALLGGRRS